jgi:hypothetical protein
MSANRVPAPKLRELLALCYPCAMAFAGSDLDAFLTALRSHPEWLSHVRAEVLGEELISLPDIVRDLAEAQRRTEARLEELVDAQRRTEGRVEELAEAQRRTELQVAELAKQVSNLAGRTGNLEGLWFEDQWERHAPAKLGLHIKRGKIVWVTDIPELDDALADGRISRTDWEDLVALDVIVWGSDRVDPAQGAYYAAVEISKTIDERDVAWAARRAELLGRLGVPARPFVGGQAIGADAADLAARLAVTVVADRAAA